jgi:ribosome maturation factor RimP
MELLVSREAAQVERLIAPSVEAMGFVLVQVRFIGGRNHPTLQVMAERRDEVEMTVEDCAELSRAISALLDVEDPVPTSYQLEVSSPGIDRPLVRLEDYERFAGHAARLETERPIDGRKRFKGKLLGVADGRIRLSLDDTGTDAEIPFAAVSKAKLVLTDELIAQSLKRRG